MQPKLGVSSAAEEPFHPHFSVCRILTDSARHALIQTCGYIPLQICPVDADVSGEEEARAPAPGDTESLQIFADNGEEGDVWALVPYGPADSEPAAAAEVVSSWGVEARATSSLAALPPPAPTPSLVTVPAQMSCHSVAKQAAGETDSQFSVLWLAQSFEGHMRWRKIHTAFPSPSPH